MATPEEVAKAEEEKKKAEAAKNQPPKDPDLMSRLFTTTNVLLAGGLGVATWALSGGIGWGLVAALFTAFVAPNFIGGGEEKKDDVLTKPTVTKTTKPDTTTPPPPPLAAGVSMELKQDEEYRKAATNVNYNYVEWPQTVNGRKIRIYGQYENIAGKPESLVPSQIVIGDEYGSFAWLADTKLRERNADLIVDTKKIQEALKAKDPLSLPLNRKSPAQLTFTPDAAMQSSILAYANKAFDGKKLRVAIPAPARAEDVVILGAVDQTPEQIKGNDGWNLPKDKKLVNKTQWVRDGSNDRFYSNWAYTAVRDAKTGQLRRGYVAAGANKTNDGKLEADTLYFRTEIGDGSWITVPLAKPLTIGTGNIVAPDLNQPRRNALEGAIFESLTRQPSLMDHFPVAPLALNTTYAVEPVSAAILDTKSNPQQIKFHKTDSGEWISDQELTFTINRGAKTETVKAKVVGVKESASTTNLDLNSLKLSHFILEKDKKIAIPGPKHLDGPTRDATNYSLELSKFGAAIAESYRDTLNHSTAPGVGKFTEEELEKQSKNLATAINVTTGGAGVLITSNLRPTPTPPAAGAPAAAPPAK